MTTDMNGIGQKDKIAYDYSDDDDELSSDSDSDTEKPREKIEIERSVDLATLKSTFSSNREEIPKFNREEIVIDKDAYSSSKNRFAKGEKAAETDEDKSQPRQKIEIERTEADKNRVLKTFFQPSSASVGVADGNEKICGLCHEVVYSIGRVTIRNRTYHKQCFSCCECGKQLSGNDVVIKERQLYCKFHGLQKLRPELTLTKEMAESMQISDQTDDFDDEEYAIVTIPRALDSGVIRSNVKMSDDLESIPNLQDKKQEWTKCAEQASRVEKKTELESGLIEQGRVKSQMTKFVEGDINDGEAVELNDAAMEEDYKNANLVRPMSKKRGEIKLDVDAKSIKSKFESGAIDNISPVPKDYESRLEELESIKSDGVSVRDRYKGQQEQSPVDAARRKSVLEDITAATTESIQQAKERFLKGESAFQELGTSHEKSKDVINYEMGSVKEKFENPLGRKEEKYTEDLMSKIPHSARCAELESLKASFESGGKKKYTEEEIEARRKRHLEKEFKRLQIEKGIFDEKQRREAEEEASLHKMEAPTEEEIKRCAELNTLKQRFEQGLVASENVAAARAAAGLEEGLINPEAKSIKAKFESNAFAVDPKVQETNEERRRHIQAEFEHFKEESQMMGKEENAETVPENVDLKDPELAQAREHAQKMRAKWDKMQRKEAKRAQKAANMKSQKTNQAVLRYQTSAEICWACDKKVYIAESVDCDNRLYHKTCFKCKQCGCSLRLETCATGSNGIYCPIHYKSLFNDMSQQVQRIEQITSLSLNQNHHTKVPISQDEKEITNYEAECIAEDFQDDYLEPSDAEEGAQARLDDLIN